MNFRKFNYWTIELKDNKVEIEKNKAIDILRNISKYIPYLNDFSIYQENKIEKYSLRTYGNLAKVVISSESLDFNFYNDVENIREWFEFPEIVFSIIENSELVDPLYVNYVKRAISDVFTTKINHGQIMNEIFCKNNVFSNIIKDKKLLGFYPEFTILLNKQNQVYNTINFRSDSSFIEDMENQYRSPEQLLLFFDVIKSRGFNPDSKFTEIFKMFDPYFENEYYDSFIDYMERPIYKFIEANDL
ncbi:hypothetical protein [Leadbettera azotonutricia]|uniref:Uncharacterized protein n=1 Tax=Leadbettera azotonutricia (strain ATCC BAA-888 / DSM 13862 / ZAS-9) TaxID=545695 RepID=F5YE45_LEAAZ|nr:hypothetical protein [Leadbettera azotonutricia]AEF81967.1 conserved hypothetical protein [Leadbettera azotonutricia ZAS-9]